MTDLRWRIINIEGKLIFHLHHWLVVSMGRVTKLSDWLTQWHQRLVDESAREIERLKDEGKS